MRRHVLLIALVLGACAPEDNSDPVPFTLPPDVGVALANDAGVLATVDAEVTPAASELGQDLAYLYETEKLARDIYQDMFERHAYRPFEIAARDGQLKMNQVLAVIHAFELPSPAPDAGPGVFVEPALDELFTAFIAASLPSKASALSVGAAVEELALADLAQMTARADAFPSVQAFYSDLACEARNDLRGLVSLLEARGESYEAQFLTPAALSAVLSTPQEMCTSGGGGGGGGRR